MLVSFLTTVCSGQVLISGNDTVSCYTNKELRVITKAVLHGKECDTLLSVCEKQRALSDSVQKSLNQALSIQSVIVKNQEEIISNQIKIVKTKDYQIIKLTDELTEQVKATRIQKMYKWAAIIVGGVASGYMAYKYATK